MPTFRYQAVQAGVRRKRAGLVEAADEAEAVRLLKAKGLSPIAISLARRRGAVGWPKGIGGGPGGARERRGDSAQGTGSGTVGRWLRASIARPRVKPARVALFTRQLATLVGAGMPLLRSLELLVRQDRGSSLRPVLADLAEVIRAGESLSAGLGRHPQAFDPLYANMVRAGEAGGMLDTVLERLAQFLEKTEKVRGKVKAAMAYPIIVMIVAGGIVMALTTFVVPKFEQIFLTQLQGRSLPALTQAVLVVSKGVARHFAFLVAGGLVAVVAAGWAGRQEWTRRWRDRAVLRLPVLGEFVLRVAVARFARIFGTLLSAGVPILQALMLTREATANRAVAGALAQLHGRLEAGATVAGSLEETALFPPLLPAMAEVGEATGKLPEMLESIADLYEDQVDNAVASFTSIIEPVMIVLMALVVGTIVIALFLPMIEIIKGLSGG